MQIVSLEKICMKSQRLFSKKNIYQFVDFAQRMVSVRALALSRINRQIKLIFFFTENRTCNFIQIVVNDICQFAWKIKSYALW